MAPKKKAKDLPKKVSAGAAKQVKGGMRKLDPLSKK